MKQNIHQVKQSMYTGLLRISMGLIFLWAFFDKLLGFGYATTPDKSWITGHSPTVGFLKFGTYGPFKDLFQNLAGNPIVDWLFMMGLLGVGVALTLGIAKKLSTMSGSLMLLLMYLAAFPPKNHPFIDEHIVYIFVIQLLLQLRSGEVMGLANLWNNTKFVKKYPFFK